MRQTVVNMGDRAVRGVVPDVFAWWEPNRGSPPPPLP